MIRRRSILFLMAVLLSLTAAGQTPDAVVISHNESFTLQSSQSGVYKVSAEVLVNNENGVSQATPLIYTDSFRSVGTFSGELETGGRKLKFGKKDLYTQSISSGLAEDSFISGYSPSGHYPFTVRYEYTVNYKGGVNTFPVFLPLASDNVLLKSASYKLDLPTETQIVCYSSNVTPLQVSEQKGRSIYEWQVKDFQPIQDEFLMPSTREMVPMVYAAPKSFSYAGTTGTQADWKEYGLWLSNISQGTDTLSPETQAKLQDMTKDCKNSYEKLCVLYQYLREKTRYVAIELGIGKLKPIAAAEVDRSGFGDCKALSNYLYTMLKAVGVPSIYYIINTHNKDLMPGFTATGQMNHAMLAVPLPELKDTVFVECTNPKIPLGYRHEDVAGHEIVLIKPEGGELVRVGAYHDSLSCCKQEFDVALAADGSATVNVSRHLMLDYTENYFSWGDLKPDTREQMLTAGLKLHPEDVKILSESDNFADYGKCGRGFCPRKTINYSFRTLRYARIESGRIFIPLNPVSKRLPIQKKVRVNDIEIPSGYTSSDMIRIHIPKGYDIESLPESVSFDTPWAEFKSSVERHDDSIYIVQTLQFKKYRSGSDTYAQFREFARKVNRCYDADLVLTAKN